MWHKMNKMIDKKFIRNGIVVILVYLLGAITVKYQLPPYNFIKSLRGKVVDHKEQQKGQQSELDKKFKSDIIEHDSLLYQAIRDERELCKRINNMLVDIDNFDSAYDSINILSPSIKGNKLTLIYKYKSRIDTAFAYYKKSKTINSNIGFNIIPGSGINQSSAMFYLNKYDKNPQTTYTGNDSNYQSNIDDLALNYGDVFILVKPNEDFLAIHNGSHKISEVEFVNYLLNIGGSYSAYYMIQGLALSKYLDDKYGSFAVCGLSQGGMAALINSLQCEPDIAIIASGYSILQDFPTASAHDQIIIPGLKKYFYSESIKPIIGHSKTNFLFTWGELETGIYGKEAQHKWASTYFEDQNNIKTVVHPEGHIYHEKTIINFLDSLKANATQQ